MLTKNKLKELERLATLFFTIKQAAVILQVKHKLLRSRIEIEDTPESQAYNRGLLKSEFEVREKIIEMAKRGSSKAQLSALEMIQNVKLENDETS